LNVDIDVHQEAPVHGSADGEVLALREDDYTTVVALMKSSKDVGGVVETRSTSGEHTLAVARLSGV